MTSVDFIAEQWTRLDDAQLAAALGGCRKFATVSGSAGKAGASGTRRRSQNGTNRSVAVCFRSYAA